MNNYIITDSRGQLLKTAELKGYKVTIIEPHKEMNKAADKLSSSKEADLKYYAHLDRGYIKFLDLEDLSYEIVAAKEKATEFQTKEVAQKLLELVIKDRISLRYWTFNELWKIECGVTSENEEAPFEIMKRVVQDSRSRPLNFQIKIQHLSDLFVPIEKKLYLECPKRDDSLLPIIIKYES